MSAGKMIRSVAKKILPKPVKVAVKRAIGMPTSQPPVAAADRSSSKMTSAEYWTEHNVTHHCKYKSAEDSIESFHWRNSQYFHYIDRLMPVHGRDGEVVLDYGCGPGHDVVGFACFSNPRRLIAMDVSSTSLGEAKARLALHGKSPEFIQISEGKPIPLEDASVDYIHSSGVLHHIADLPPVLRELRRVLKPSGQARFMVYNYDSIFVHLHVAYCEMIEQGKFPGETVRQAFSHLTDGLMCPISLAYTASEFLAVLRDAGFEAEHSGNSISTYEMEMLNKRFKAIQDQRLPREHREFLFTLKLDQDGFPLHKGQIAGVDGCFRATRR